jgi:glycerol-3-phosphate dehydrogenase subunit B
MTTADVVVVGAGMAGTAAAWAAARAGKRVTVIHDRAGSSALSSGALDLEPWDAPRPEGPPLPATNGAVDAARDEALRAFIAALGVHRLAPGLVATGSGVVRPVLGADDALLELAPLAGRRVAVADIGRDDWDAALLARTLSGSRWAETTNTLFFPVPVKALRAGHERRTAVYDFAALHDDEQRRASLAAALKFASENVDAWLTGPWLGLERESIGVLRRLVPMPLGETTSPLGGPAGARFEAARDRLLAAERIAVVQARMTAIAERGTRWVVTFTGEGPGSDELEASAVVLATGGVAAGGLSFSAIPSGTARGFALPFAAPVLVALDGEILGGGGSLYGPSLEIVGLGVLERAGIAVRGQGPAAAAKNEEEPSLFAAGDAVAGRPRTMLEAARAGLEAGTVAARV